MARFTWYYKDMKFDSESAKLYAAGVRDASKMLCPDGQIWGRSNWWTYENGLLYIYCVGDMPNYKKYRMPPWYSYRDKITRVMIENTTTTIGDYAFFGCIGLTNVTIPNSVTSIGFDAFCYCTALTGIIIPDSVTEIGRDAFLGCTSLTSVTIPDSVTEIYDWMFEDCASLTSVTIPDSVTLIDYGVFYGCNQLSDVYYAGTQAQWDAIVIKNHNTPLTNATIHYNSTGP